MKKDLDQYGKLNLRMCNHTKTDDISLWSDTYDFICRKHNRNSVTLLFKGVVVSSHFQRKHDAKMSQKACIANYNI